MNKGIIFAGDSFVWGEGLELFSELPSTKKYFETQEYSMKGPYNRAWNPEFKYSMKMYQEKNRFARLVVNHFDTWEDVYDRNGGCPYSNLDELLQQMNRTPLTDVNSIILHPTDIWRGIEAFRKIHPAGKYFSPTELIKGDNLSNFFFKQNLPILGTGDGYDKYDSPSKTILGGDIMPIQERFSSVKIDSLNDLFIFCYIYHQYDNKIINQTELIHRISTQLHPIDTLNFKTLRCMKECYDFFFSEYSNYGDKIDEIQKNLENKLVGEYFSFVNTYIKPKCDEHGVTLLYLPVWNETHSAYRDFGDTHYDNNKIPILCNGTEYESFYYLWQDFMIDRTPGYEWTHNMHPNLNGHKVISNSIIKYYEKNNIF